MTDVVIVGGGLNGLVAAATLARAKLSVVLLDRRPSLGGACITTELAPGFRVPTLSHSLGPVSRDVVKGLRLDKVRDLEFITPDPTLTSIGEDGRTLTFHRDAVLTATSINALSTNDAGRWNDFVRTSQRIASVLSGLDRLAPPPIDEAGMVEIWRLMRAGRAARKLSRRDLGRLARWLPMSIADVASEWFESDQLRAALAAHAISGHAAGPRSAGTGSLWLQRMAGDPFPVGSGVTVRGGPGALTEAIAAIATKAGASLRTDAHVTGILTKDGRATGVVLSNGDQIGARAVMGAISPKSLMSRLVSPADLPPTFAQRMRHVRARGVTAKINLALSSLPAFSGLGADAVPLRGRLLIAPGLDYLEQAFDATKYGAVSQRPWLEIVIPSVRDTSLAPDGAHVMSVMVHFAPLQLRGTTWATERETLWTRVANLFEQIAPGVTRQIVAREMLTPADLQDQWGLEGGHIFHVEGALDQMWAARPLLGWSRYRTPIAGLYFASAGAHPGGGLTGLPGWLASQAVRSDLKKLK